MTVRKSYISMSREGVCGSIKMPVSQSIYQFKYRNRRVFAQYYAEQMAGQFCRSVKKMAD